jgi:hypothetical protein
LAQLGVPAATVLLAVLDRAGVAPGSSAGLRLDGAEVELSELPPLATVGALR